MDFLIPILVLAVLLLVLGLQSLRARLKWLSCGSGARTDGSRSRSRSCSILRRPSPPPSRPCRRRAGRRASRAPRVAAAARIVTLEAEPEPVGEEGRPAPSESLGGLFERLVAGRLLIWLGGIALVLAAVFLIRYSIDIGLVTPAARMAGAGLFGLILVGAGEYARHGRLADDPRVAQALAGAGIAVLYATCYGSYRLHALIDAQAASGRMLR